MNEKTINDIYTGRPDAKDEIKFDGIEDFVNSIVIPDTFNINNLLNKNHCFITGYKGTGKTALLFYLEFLLKEKTPYACTSFMFFKDEFTETRKQELEGYSRRILSSVIFERNALINDCDFEYIWRWLLFKRIVSDNEEYENNLFVNNDEWIKFKGIMGKIKSPIDAKKNIITSKIKLALSYKDVPSQSEFTPEVEVDFNNKNKNGHYAKFLALIDDAEICLRNLTRTDVPYFIFIDELEAYYGEEKIFKRDLCFIRDLLFTVKRINSIFVTLGEQTKIICSARTELINSISRFVIPKELNKVTNGFEVPLIWNYNNTSSYQHPIIQLLLKRIDMCEKNETINYKDIYDRWFPEKIHNIEPAGYILNNSWNKPRDIVRLISSAQNTIKANERVFNQSVFDAIKKKYSVDSLEEIKEELRALYSVDEINLIINCFSGYKSVLSINTLKERIKKYFPDTILEKNLIIILQDLYRLGFIGNYFPASKTYRWQHKGDDGIIFSDEWRIMVHYALQSALSIGSKQDYGQARNSTIEVGDVATTIVTRIIRNFIFVDINYFGKIYPGYLHISKLNMGYVKNIFDIFSEGDEVIAEVIGYNEKHKNWELSLENIVLDIEE